MCSSEKVAELNEFAMSFVFNVDDTPFIGSGADDFAVYGHCFFRADDGEGDAVLRDLVNVNANTNTDITGLEWRSGEREGRGRDGGP